ncbi:MAG: arylamine N-acetyltransferase [Porticoccaceae bacterium]
MTNTSTLPPALVEKILERLGLHAAPGIDLPGLETLYAAWCREVPFDNIRKLIHLRGGAADNLPGSRAQDFFEAWLAHGTGGTCWPGNGALYALLAALGFAARRGVGTMPVTLDIPPNHGIALVDLDGVTHAVDASIAYVAPLPLVDGETASVDHPAWGARSFQSDGTWHIGFRPLHIPQGLECRIDSLCVSGDDFHQWHQHTRRWSPFNYELYIRTLRGDSVVGIAFGQWIEFDGDGGVNQRPLSEDERKRVLIDELGINEAIVQALPTDIPTPPRPTA